MKQVALFFLGITLVLTLSWFRSESFVALGDEGLLFYSSQRTRERSSSIWQEIDLGFATPLHITRYPLFLITSLFERISVPGWLIEAIVMWSSMFFGLTYAFKTFEKLLKSYPKWISLTAALFYLCNLFVISQVFARFIFSLIFLWTLFPIHLYYFIRWLETGKFSNLFKISFFTSIYSLTFLIISPIFVIWIPIPLYCLLVVQQKHQSVKVLLLRTVIFVSTWALVSSWWILPILITSGGGHAALTGFQQNYQSLRDVSKYFSNLDVLTLRQKYYFGESGVLRNYFDPGILAIVPLAILGVTVFGVLTIKKKNSEVLFLLLLLIVGWFLVKGSNSPFGERFFYWIFNFFSPAQSLRNPYEKAGILYVFAYSSFFAIGLYKLYTLLGKFKKGITVTFLILVLVALAKPLWDRSLFRGSFIEVPDEYRVINNYISEIGTSYRIFHMPYPKTGNARLSWAPLLFGVNDSVLGNPSFPNQVLQGNEDFYQSLVEAVPNKNFHNILKITSTCCVVLHNDILFNENYSQSISDAKSTIEKWPEVTFATASGNLQLFLTNPMSRPNRVYLANKLIIVQTVKEAIQEFLRDDFSYSETAIMTVEQNKKVTRDPFTSKNNPDYFLIFSKSNKYQLKISDSKEEFVLILANSYDPNWKAIIDNREISNHFEVNGFANGWVVNVKGDFIIDIIYKALPWD